MRPPRSQIVEWSLNAFLGEVGRLLVTARWPRQPVLSTLIFARNGIPPYSSETSTRKFRGSPFLAWIPLCIFCGMRFVVVFTAEISRKNYTPPIFFGLSIDM